MISTCANLACGKAFDYQEGKFFRFRQHRAANERANAHAVQHLWLCGNCSQKYSLEEASQWYGGRAEVEPWSVNVDAVPEVAIRLIPRAHLSPEAVGG